MSSKLRSLLKKIYLNLTRHKVIDALKIKIMEKVSFKIAKECSYKDKPEIFETIFLETRTLCNGNCSFCASSRRYRHMPWARKDKMMPEKTVKKVLSELKKINFKGRIAFHVNNEPLLEPRLLKFVKMARKACPQAYIQILTNGLLLTKDKGEKLLKAGINELNINNYSDKLVFRENIEEFLRSMVPKFPNVKIEAHLRKETAILTNRAGSSPVGIPINKPMRAMCGYPFKQFNITVNGDVGLCCQDLFFKQVMGNVNKKKILDIWFGSSFIWARKELLKGNRKSIPLCSKCDSAGYKTVQLKQLPFYWSFLGRLAMER